MAFRSFAAEFPNDNSELHVGTIWMSEEPCGGAVPHFSDWVDPTPDEPIEIVETLDELEGAIEVVPAPVEVMAAPIAVVPAVAAPLEVIEAAGPLVEAPIEAVVEAVETIPVPLESGIVASGSLAEEDPYGNFLQTLADVARESAHPFAITEIASAMADDDVARAWCAILRGESEDFTLCGMPLDEWASNKLAQIVSAPHKAAQLRRELRSRGVAAFGLVEAA